MVLLHALAGCVPGGSAENRVPVLAIHVDHGLQPDSSRWSEHCEASATALNIAFVSLKVDVPLDSGKGLEASARDVRYAALCSELRSGDWLLSAHHREDQAETLLLNLIRGSGPAGVAGIGAARRLGPGWLVRPMLNVDRADILSYAEREGLIWLEDPSNIDRRFDRNFLRHDVIPTMKSRWPDIATRLHRSAGHAGEASQLLQDLAAMDLDTLRGSSDSGVRVPIAALSALSPARQRNVLRYALRDQGLSTPSASQLERILTELVPARADAEPVVSWPGASVRRYRDDIYLLPEMKPAELKAATISGSTVHLGEGLGVLKLTPGAESGLSEALVKAGLTLRSRRGGEELKPAGHRHTRKLKKLLQDEAVVPWMRECLPLLYAGERLVAVGDLWMASDAVSSPGVAVQWIGRPALH